MQATVFYFQSASDLRGIVFPRMALSGGDIANAALAMLAVVPAHEGLPSPDRQSRAPGIPVPDSGE